MANVARLATPAYEQELRGGGAAAEAQAFVCVLLSLLVYVSSEHTFPLFTVRYVGWSFVVKSLGLFRSMAMVEECSHKMRIQDWIELEYPMHSQ